MSSATPPTVCFIIRSVIFRGSSPGEDIFETQLPPLAYESAASADLPLRFPAAVRALFQFRVGDPLLLLELPALFALVLVGRHVISPRFVP
jgi:hypothetical protein